MRMTGAGIFAATLILILLPNFSSAAVLDKYYSEPMESSLAYFISEAASDTQNVMKHYEAACALKEFGRNQEALTEYEQIIPTIQNKNQITLETAKLHYFLGDYLKAEEALVTILNSESANWEAYYWLGCVYLESGRIVEAEEKLHKVVEINSEKNITYIKLGQLYEKKADFVNAIINYKLAIRYDKTYTELYRKIAELYELQNDNIKAYNYWHKIQNIDTNNEVAIQKTNQFMATIPYLQKKAKEFVDLKKTERAMIMPPDKKGVADIENIAQIKVGLMQGVSSISLKCGSGFDFANEKSETVFKGLKLTEYFFEYDKDKAEPFFSDNITKTYFKKDMYLLISNPEATTTIYNIQYAQGFYWSEKKDTTYRGNFLVRYQDGGFTLINLINMEEYLYGVVPSEIPSNWSQEALKAQAVAARTYTFQHMEKHIKKGFDVCSQQHCAVYSGLNGENKSTNIAVNDTRGQVLYGSNSKLLDTFYSHCCGGYTQDASEVWGMHKNNSLIGVYDGKNNMWNFPLSPYFLEQYVRTSPKVYCTATGEQETSFRWIRYLDANSLSYYLDRKGELGKIKEVKPLKRAKGGALTKLYILGDKGNKTYDFDSMRTVLGKMRSNVVKWEYMKDSQGYVKEIYIYGAGWGHGVGMCQRGLKGMAEDNQDYKSMLYHYFPGAYIKNRY